MNASKSIGDGSYEPAKAEKADEILPIIKNDSNIHGIVSAHRDEALLIFKTDKPASKMVTLRMKNLSAMKSCMPVLSLSPPVSMHSALQEILAKSEEEALKLFQILTGYCDGVLKLFKADAPASRMISLRMENLSAMKSFMDFSPTLPDELKNLLAKSEEEAMDQFQKEHLDTSNSGKNNIRNDCDTNASFGDEEKNGVQDSIAAAVDSKNDDLVEHEILPRPDNSPISDLNDGGSPKEGAFVSIRTIESTSPIKCSSEDYVASLEPPKQSNAKKTFQDTGNGNLSSSYNSDNGGSGEGMSGDSEHEDGDGLSVNKHLCLTPRRKEKTAPILRRILPHRRCSNKRKRDFGYSDNLDVDVDYTRKFLSATKSSSEKRTTMVLGSEDGSSHYSPKGTELKKSGDVTKGTVPSIRSVVEDRLNVTSNFMSQLLKSLTGCSGKYHTNSGIRYYAMIGHQGDYHGLGTYELATDAAHAYDQAMQLLKGPKWRKANFATDKDYKELREKELIENGLDVDLETTLAKIESYVTTIASKQGISMFNSDAREQDRLNTISGFQSALIKSLTGFLHKNYKSSVITYYAQIGHQGTMHSLGRYELATDAAHAYDQAARLLKGPNWKVNFAAYNDYKKLRTKELIENGLDVDLETTLAEIESNVTDIASTQGISAYKTARGIVHLKGAHWNKNKTMYESVLTYQYKRYCLGWYKLQSDAALAYDEAVELHHRSGRKKSQKSVGRNFVTKQHHINTRNVEMKANKLAVDLETILAEILANVNDFALQIGSATMNAIDVAAVERDDEHTESPNKNAEFEYLLGYSEVTKLGDNLRLDSMVGVHSQRSGHYRAAIGYLARRYYLGTYKLQSDAALAYDVATRALRGPQWRGKVNFGSKHAHRTVRAAELKMTGLDVSLDETLVTISAWVKGAASEIGVPITDYVDESCNANDTLGYAITENALAAIEFNINNTVSNICHPECMNSAVRRLRDMRLQAFMCLQCPKSSRYNGDAGTDPDIETKKRARKTSSDGSSASAAPKVKDFVSYPIKEERSTAVVAYEDTGLIPDTLCGVTMQQGNWQSQVYYAGRLHCVGVFETKEKASLACHIAQEVLKTGKGEPGPANAEDADWNVDLARKAVLSGVCEEKDTEW